MFNFIKKHSKLGDRIFFVAWYRKSIITITHIEMTSSRLRRLKTDLLEFLNEFSSLTWLPFNHGPLHLYEKQAFLGSS